MTDADQICASPGIVGTQLGPLCDCRGILKQNDKMYQDYAVRLKTYRDMEDALNNYNIQLAEWDKKRKEYQTPLDEYREKTTWCQDFGNIGKTVQSACPDLNPNLKFIGQEVNNSTCWNVTCGYSDDYIARSMNAWKVQHTPPPPVPDPILPGTLIGQDVNCCLQQFSNITGDSVAFRNIIQTCGEALDCCVQNPQACVRDSYGRILSCQADSPTQSPSLPPSLPPSTTPLASQTPSPPGQYSPSPSPTTTSGVEAWFSTHIALVASIATVLVAILAYLLFR